MKYYRLLPKPGDQWLLAFRTRVPADDGRYIRGEFAEPPVTDELFILGEGRPVDFNVTPFGTTIVSSRVGDIVDELARQDIQRIPVSVVGVEDSWEIMNIVTVLDCIDHERSDILYYPANHSQYPGKPRMVSRMVLDVHKAEGYHIFRLAGWLVPTIVSEALRQTLLTADLTDVDFQDVSG